MSATVQTITSGSDQRKNVPTVTVESFYNAHAEKLQLKLEGKCVGFHRKIREPTINRPGLALSGFYTYFADKRMQVLGAAEQSYLKSLSPQVRRRSGFVHFASRKFPVSSRRAVLISIPICWPWPTNVGVAVFRTPMITMKFINAATIALEMDFSPTVTEFGSMVDILGIGVLIRGASGVGKSECVLGLIERGYSLVSDDVTRIKSLEGRELMATAPDLTRNHMEVRGIGIINVVSIFGIGSIRNEKRLDLVVTLKDWQELEEVDRIGLDQEFYEILKLQVPHVTIPVRPGRDIARIVEVAGMDQKLKGMGQNSALEFNTKLLQLMEKRLMGLLNRKGAGAEHCQKVEKDIPVVNRLGLHARPAAMFVRIASRYRCEVWVDKEGEEVNGKSIMGLMMLAAGQGSNCCPLRRRRREQGDARTRRADQSRLQRRLIRKAFARPQLRYSPAR